MSSSSSSHAVTADLPQVYCIRHAQSLYNEYTAEYIRRQHLMDPSRSLREVEHEYAQRWDMAFVDAPLTSKGIHQALELHSKVERDGLVFDLIITSPMTRAIQTALIALQTSHKQHPHAQQDNPGAPADTDNASGDGAKVMLCHYHCERLSKLCDVGRPVGDIMKTFADFTLDASLIPTDAYDGWWYLPEVNTPSKFNITLTNPEAPVPLTAESAPPIRPPPDDLPVTLDVVSAEPPEPFLKRIRHLIQYIMTLPSHYKIAIVGHSESLRAIGAGYQLHNAELVKLDWNVINPTLLQKN